MSRRIAVNSLWREDRDGMHLSVFQYGIQLNDPEPFCFSVGVENYQSLDDKHIFHDSFSLHFNGCRKTLEEAIEAAKFFADRLKPAVAALPMVPMCRQREIEAGQVNRSPAVDGYETWKCEECGVEWVTEVDNTVMKNGQKYDRTKDPSNWPVLCDKCLGRGRNG